MRHILLVFLLNIPALNAQTSLSVPLASGSGIKAVLPVSSSGHVFGVNLDDSFYYGNNQLTANLVADNPLSFTPQIWQQTSTCKSGSTTQWIDASAESTQPANFWRGAAYQVVSGADKGKAGTITASAAANGSNGQTFTGKWTKACSSGDLMILRCRTALSTCAGGYTAEHSGLSLPVTGSGSAKFETTDVSPHSQSPQALELVAPGISTAAVVAPFDATDGVKAYINLNGGYTLTFRAKATSGNPVISYQANRCCGPPYFVNGTVNPTVNPTPAAGWTDYAEPFAASETGAQTQTGYVTIRVTGGTVLLQDVALTETPSGGNTTAFRNAVFQRLTALQPGILRFMTGAQWGCTFDNMIAGYSGRAICGNSVDGLYGHVIPYGLNDFLTLAKAVGADPWWTFSVDSSAADMENIAAYLSGTCGNGNRYTALRCESGQTAPWTSVFRHIYLEMGNEVWNSPNGQNMFAGGGAVYGSVLGTNIAALKASPYYTSNIKVVASGWIAEPNCCDGWNPTVLKAANSVPNGLPDYIDGAPYVFNFLTDTTSTQAIFGAMFAEPVNLTTSLPYPQGTTYFLQNYASAAFGVQGAIYETNMGTTCGLAGVSQATINNVVAGVGAALDATLNMLLSARDAGVKVINFFALPEDANGFTEASSPTAGNCGSGGSLRAPLWGLNLFMPGPTNAYAIDRPTGIALQMVNAAMRTNLLNVVQTGTPTYNQPAAQPNPFNKTNSIAANRAVPLVQSFGFSDGAGNYSLIVYNLSLAAREEIAFTGAGAPVGPVTKAVFTSPNITDNNESLTIGRVPVVGMPSSKVLTSPRTDTLPPFSMTVYTWTIPAR